MNELSGIGIWRVIVKNACFDGMNKKIGENKEEDERCY